MKRHALLSTIAIIVIGAFVFWLTQRNWLIYSDWWQKAEGSLIDYRYLGRGIKPADTNIVLVGVETSSLTLDALNPEEIEASPVLQEMGKPYPWNRSVYAATLEKLVNAGAKVVVFDFVFSGAKEGDEVFAQALEKYRDHVVLGSMFEPKERKYTEPNASLLRANMEDSIGLVNIGTELDGIVRRGRYRTSMERETPELSKFASRYEDNLIHMSALAVKKFAGSVDTPPYDSGNFIDFQGPKGRYKPIPIETLFVPKLWENPPLNGATRFAGKMVIVGPIANIFHDVHDTPFDEVPGPELQAQMMAALLNHSWLDEPSPKYSTLLTLGMIIGALFICLFVSHAGLKSILLVGTAGGFWAVCQYAFNSANVVVQMMPPLFGFVTTGATSMALQFVFEQIERRRYRNVLDRYVSKNVAETILADQRSFEESLSGQKKAVVILFSDIRGFTSMTEDRDPEQLVNQLNEYFKEMVGVVLHEKGTLQKFIGDAIMAAWGDAHTEGPEEDARHAVRTALRMRAGLEKLNAQWKQLPNRTPLQIGIGVNFGEAIVGNIGSPARMEFTVLGDAVNFAARLESATKQFHSDLLVGESVEALVRKHFVFRRVGLLTVKGKVKPVEAFNVVSERSAPPWLDRYHEAVAMFRRREFKEATVVFQSVLKETGGKDYLCEMHIEWCERYEKNPPPADWAGNFVLSEK